MAVDSFFEGGAGGKRKRTSAAPRSRDAGSSSKGKGRAIDRPAAARADRDGRSKKNQQQQQRRTAATNGRGADEDGGASGSGLSSNDDDDDDAIGSEGVATDVDSEEEEARKETPAQKRLRLARQYLDSLKAGKDEGGIDAAELERDIINERLQKDVLEASGKLHLRIADQISLDNLRLYKTPAKVHRLPVTCAVATEDCSSLFTAGKDGAIARYDISSLIASSSSSSSSSSSLPAQTATGSTTPASGPRIVKTDFIPKRLAKGKGKGVANQSHQDGSKRTKGKAAIARNQPSQDVETRGHTDEIYSISVSSDKTRLVSGGKDRRIGVWDISRAPRDSSAALPAVNGKEHADKAASNGKEGAKNDRPEGGCRWIRGLKGHKDSISSVAFRTGTSQVYSSSFDRTVKIYDALSLTYVETLFGHQDKILDLAVARNELAVTAGARDKTLRYWKIKDESQLVFRAGVTSKIRRMLEGGMEEDLDEDGQRAGRKALVNGSQHHVVEKHYVEGSVDCTALIDDQHFVSGGDSGTISLWSIAKKKPIFTKALAHGVDTIHSETEGELTNPRYIVSLATLPYSNLFCSGSWDGSVKLWKVSDDIKSFELVGQIPGMLGFVNSLQLLQLPARKQKKGAHSATAQAGTVMVVVSLGQEPKFGRYMRVGNTHNNAVVAIL